jgi:hypothetical protein
VTPAPVLFACANGGFPLENWSGREDSNLRPLPPEGVAPRLTRARFAISSGNRIAPKQIRFGTVSARRFNLNLGPCLFGGLDGLR